MPVFETIPSKQIDDYIDCAIILDLRPREEFMREHIKGAISVPYEHLKKYKGLKKDRPIILYCERGAISMMAARELCRRGYHVKTVVGGLHLYRGNNLESFC